MRQQIKRLLALVLLMAPLAAAGVFLFKTLDARNGLTSSQINCIVKDGRGYIWLGTPAGLYRYDGYVFKNFQSNSQDGSSLPDSYIYNVQEALDGNLWVSTASGICVYHPQTETFERDMKQVYTRFGVSDMPTIVYIDRQKNLWMYVPQKGVLAYNMQQQLLYEFGYTDDATGIPQGKVCSFGECRDGAIIVYENGLLVCCDIRHEQRRVWKTDEVAKKRLRVSSSLKVFADQKDNVWLYGQGTLMCYHKKANTWDTTAGNSLGLTGTGVDRCVYGMAGDRSGNIWIATDRTGLLRANVNTHEMEPVQPAGQDDTPRGEGPVNTQSVYVDNTDLLWVGTERNGLAFYGKDIYRFSADHIGDVTAIAEDVEGKVWYGTSDRGLLGYSGPVSGRSVSALACTNDGSLWVGTKQSGLTRIKSGGATLYNAADRSKTLINNHINALCKDKTGNLWIATDGGLQVFNPKMNSFSSYTKENGRLTTNNITSLFYGSNNNLLVGTGEGLMILNLSTTEKTMFTGNAANTTPLTNNYVTQVYEDSRGLYWIGTREGVNILSRDNDKLYYLTEREGLCNNNVCGITEDGKHNMWVTTSNGVSRVVVQRDHENGTFNFGLYNYDTTDGLQSNEFNKGAILTKRNGSVELGGLYGVNRLRRIGKNGQESLPRVMLTQLFVGEKEILIGHAYDGTIILPQALNESKRIELDNDQNTFTIKFAAGNYNQSERLQFMYWMEGLDNDWKNGDALHHGVTFSNLAFGTYTLHVKAVNADGAVSNQERTLEIRILPPWWLSWWMIVVYIIGAILAVYAWKFGMRQQRYIWSKKKAIINELTGLREEIKATSDDLRQPMARMTSIIGNLSEQNTTIEGREQLNALHFQMLQIITRISEMQTVLENPEAKAASTATDRLQLNDNGVVSITQLTDGELTSEIRQYRTDLPTKKYTIAVVDDNPDFLKFIMAHLQNVYDMHAYSDAKTMANDMDVLKADIIVCKQDMPQMTGSELCTMVKTNPATQSTKFVLMTDGVLTPQDMQGMNITLAADDYLAKPFNIQEAVMRFNKLLGLAPTESVSNVIEGGETRMLEGHNASMTTATESYSSLAPAEETAAERAEKAGDHLDAAPNHSDKEKRADSNYDQYYSEQEAMGDYSMNNAMDRQLMRNVEIYVLHNMSRGQINLEDMASAMGMGRVPFFHKIKSITTKTPAELVRELRLKHACTLLEKTDINMSELAINIGFLTAENFIHIFKEKFGMSPLEYRLKHRQNR